MPPRPRAHTTSWEGRNATGRAVADFELAFAKSLGINIKTVQTIKPPEVIPTGSLALDVALKIGGWPIGRVNEIWGPEHAGKTTLMGLAVAEAQRMFPNKIPAWVDMEQTLDLKWLAQLGVDLNRLWLVENPRSAEDVADSTRKFVESGMCSVVVLDSVGSMIGQKELDKDADEATMAEVARIVTRMVKAVSAIGKANGTTTMVVNQVRSRIAKYGPETHTSGGWALKHVTSIKIGLRRGASTPHNVKVDGNEIPVSYEMAAKVEKNKLAPYGTTALLWLTNQETEQWGPVGVDKADEATTIGIKIGGIEVKGAWYTTPDGERHNGRDRVVEHLRQRPEVVEEIRTRAIASMAGQLQEEKDEPEGANPDDPYGIAEVPVA